MTIVITAWDRSPDGGMGLARDTRVRWALEEVGQPYEVRFVSLRTKMEPAHLRLHPFGLIPTYEEGDLALFETGSIVFHIAERYVGLLPDDAKARARAITWMFASLSPAFLKPLNLFNVMRQVSVYGLLAIGMTFVILTRGIDLSLRYTIVPPVRWTSVHLFGSRILLTRSFSSTVHS